MIYIHIRVYIYRPKSSVQDKSWVLNTSGIPNTHENLAVCYFASKHTIPQTIKSLLASKLSTAQFFRRARAVHPLSMILLQGQSMLSDVLGMCVLLVHEVIEGTLHSHQIKHIPT